MDLARPGRKAWRRAHGLGKSSLSRAKRARSRPLRGVRGGRGAIVTRRERPPRRSPAPSAAGARPGGMERKEHRSGSPGRRSGRGGGCGPGQPQAVVQRTQVMLLAGETWEPDSAQAVLSSFAHQVLPPATTTTSSPANPPAPAAPPGTLALDSITSSANLPQPPSEAPPPPPGQASGQLIFFLCRPSSLRERLSRLREVLQGVREQSRGAPAALVGVIVQPREDEEAGARACLEDLLREVFQAEGAAPVEMHTAIFKPGRPKGALDVKRVGGGTESRREKVARTRWLDKSTLMQTLGAMLSVGALTLGGYYFYSKPPA